MMPTRSNGTRNARLPRLGVLRDTRGVGKVLLSFLLLAVLPTSDGPLCGPLWAQEPGEPLGSRVPGSSAAVGDPGERPTLGQPSPHTPSNGRSGQVLIVCGLPGDEEHAAAFEAIRLRWIRWLTGPAGFSRQQITILSGAAPPTEPGAGKGEPEAETNEPASATDWADQPRTLPATRQQLQQTAGELVERLGAEERLWVLLLGHANHDGEHAYFHLPGPDVDERMLGLLFDQVGCSEQVFWVTNSCAGWFVDRLSKPGRIVIAATAADSEYNETEFPAALAQAMERPASELDRDGDGWVAVSELFAASVAEVTAIFATDERAATEHAQLDDNGDHRGTELPDLAGLKRLTVEPAEQPAGSPAAEEPDAEDPNAKSPAAEPLPGTNPGSSATPEAQRPDDGLLAASTRIHEVPPQAVKENDEPKLEPKLEPTPDRPTKAPSPREQP